MCVSVNNTKTKNKAIICILHSQNSFIELQALIINSQIANNFEGVTVSSHQEKKIKINCVSHRHSYVYGISPLLQTTCIHCTLELISCM